MHTRENTREMHMIYPFTAHFTIMTIICPLMYSTSPVFLVFYWLPHGGANVLFMLKGNSPHRFITATWCQLRIVYFFSSIII